MKKLIGDIRAKKSIFWCGLFYGIGFFPEIPRQLIPHMPSCEYRGFEADMENLNSDWMAIGSDFKKAFNSLTPSGNE